MRPFLATAAGLLLAGCASLAGVPRSDELFSRVRTGMTQQQVRETIGAPDDSMYYPLSGQTGWGYLYFDTWGVWAEFSVTFGTDGRAVSTHSRRLDGGDRE
jgi:hypothetical protein